MSVEHETQSKSKFQSIYFLLALALPFETPSSSSPFRSTIQLCSVFTTLMLFTRYKARSCHQKQISLWYRETQAFGVTSATEWLVNIARTFWKFEGSTRKLLGNILIDFFSSRLTCTCSYFQLSLVGAEKMWCFIASTLGRTWKSFEQPIQESFTFGIRRWDSLVVSLIL